MKIKVCGMKHPDNIKSISALDLNYMGFIFYEKSPRFAKTPIEIPGSIQKVGVFVNASMEEILEKVSEFELSVVQLHGHETPAYCESLSRALAEAHQADIKLWKVFSIKSASDFEGIDPYESVVDGYLLDTKGQYRGGNGVKFNWQLLDDYHFQKPVMLSGGIEPKDAETIIKLYQKGKIEGVDVNSGFEDEPGLKNKNRLEQFIKTIRTHE